MINGQQCQLLEFQTCRFVHGSNRVKKVQSGRAILAGYGVSEFYKTKISHGFEVPEEPCKKMVSKCFFGTKEVFDKN